MSAKQKERRDRFPLRLRILPGLKWHGWMEVNRNARGEYVVDFDAIDEAAVHERWVVDRTVMTAAMVEKWTGFDPGKVAVRG